MNTCERQVGDWEGATGAEGERERERVGLSWIVNVNEGMSLSDSVSRESEYYKENMSENV